MKERPILFSGPMVRAILDGTKTQTRRALKPQPIYTGRAKDYEWDARGQVGFVPIRDAREFGPYGIPGDRLWVRETWVHGLTDLGQAPVYYRADGEDDTTLWRPSIYMPRRLSRITLEIKDVRVERLQDISENDAKSEGICYDYNVDPIGPCKWRVPGTNMGVDSPKGAFSTLWDSIATNFSRWEFNPWVWVVEFERVK